MVFCLKRRHTFGKKVISTFLYGFALGPLFPGALLVAEVLEGLMMGILLGGGPFQSL